MKFKKTLLMTALSVTLVAPTVLEAFSSEAPVTVNAAKHKAKKHKAKKGKKAKKTNKKKKVAAPKTSVQNTNTTTPTPNPTPTPSETTTTQPSTPSLSSDATAYNNAVNSLGSYAKAGSISNYTVGPGTSYPGGASVDIKNSLNAMTTDMGNTDSYDNQLFGNKAVMVFQQQVNHLYQAFQTRFTADDNNVLKENYNKVQQQWINSSSNNSTVNLQWTNITNFLSSLSNAFSKYSSN
ncbi:hypothetical protein [Lactobacillus sp. Sy-1]|uniref:hypothetical protein n=1 Tax=Lactobacillus sp. Sy-1 TaxID=2109645 RepID=UPI001C5968EB|nr:hypothetical protein [Lactobacillus sp. Sy-1]MBW1605144.1 hypothetical protein [Lactobacillus sp. Sy-1]